MGDNFPENLIMRSVVEIAARDGVTKQAVSKTVQTILTVMKNVPVERNGRGRVLRIAFHGGNEIADRLVALAPKRRRLIHCIEELPL